MVHFYHCMMGSSVQFMDKKEVGWIFDGTFLLKLNSITKVESGISNHFTLVIYSISRNRVYFIRDQKHWEIYLDVFVCALNRKVNGFSRSAFHRSLQLLNITCTYTLLHLFHTMPFQSLCTYLVYQSVISSSSIIIIITRRVH